MSKILYTYLSLVRKLIPKKIEAPAVVLDIGSYSCKLLELKKTGNTYEILNWGIDPIENADVASSVKRLLKRLNIDSKSPYTAVFGKGTLIRFIEMPRMALEDLKKSFELEAD